MDDDDDDDDDDQGENFDSLLGLAQTFRHSVTGRKQTLAGQPLESKMMLDIQRLPVLRKFCAEVLLDVAS